MNLTQTASLLLAGIVFGAVFGLFGAGVGVLIAPVLMFFYGFSLNAAIGTSAAILLLPVGLPSVLARYRQGDVHLGTAYIVASGFFLGAWLGANSAYDFNGPYFRISYGIFIICLGCYISIEAWLKSL